MPKVVLHPWIKELHGKMGDVVFKRLPNGETIMTKRPRDLAVSDYFQGKNLLSKK
jgi:hypothetical protein